MGRKKNDEQVQAVQEQANVTVDMLTVIKSEIEALVSERNECAEFGEHKAVKKLDRKIAEKVGDYNTRAEKDCFDALLKEDNPMLAAAKMLKFVGIKASEKKQEDGSAKMVIEAASRAIDPLSLHKKSDDGIGIDKKWEDSVEALNCLLTMRRAVELGLSTDGIIKNYKMSDEALTKVEAYLQDDDPTKLDKNAFDGFLRSEVQDVVDKMTGVGEVTDKMVNYLLSIYSRKNTKAELSIACATHKYMRQYMLDICNAAATGNVFSVSYKTATK